MSASTDQSTVPTTGVSAKLLLATLLLASTMTVMAGTTIAPALPAIAEHFKDLPDAQLLSQLALTMPGLFIVIAAPLAGYFSDKTGPKPVLALSAVVYILAGASGFVLDDMIHILIGRALLGMSVGGILTSAVTLIGSCYSGPHRTRVLGWQTASMALGGVIYLTAGGLLADVSWRLPFLIYAIPILLLPTIFFVVPHVRAGREPALGDSVGSIPWRLFVLAYGGAFIAMAAFYIVPVQLPFLLRDIGEASPSTAAFAIAAGNLTSAIMAILYGRIRSVISLRLAATFTFLLLGSGLYLTGVTDNIPAIFGGMVLAGAGMGLLYPSLVGMILEGAPAAIRGRATSGLTMSIFLAQFVSPIIMSALIPGGGAEWFSGAGIVMLALGLALLGMFVVRRARTRAAS